ncbi:DUF4214 domain-containing protein [Salipiger abyssi]|uniref:DUF4214 domain-containing protein n=1 Tax=Salipiger abyssi TaxID=1250539 RepID=UPI001A8E409A|nr:DUF4214 domain-containing protein [Salipiger abyssi]MBN9889815.1 DUF4214 domain-containing protein [Salipiger abyssi]
MGILRHVTTGVAGPAAHMTSVSGLLALETGGGLRVYSASGMGGGVLAWESSLILRDTGQYRASAGLDAPRFLATAELGGREALLAPGRYGREIEAWEITASGGLGARQALSFDSGPPQALLALETVALGGRDYVVTASRQSDGLEVWRLAGQDLQRVPQGVLAETPGRGTVSAIESVSIGGQTRVLALSSGQDSLYSYVLSADGRLSDVRQLDLRDGLYLDTPTALETVDLAGRTYMLIGAGNGAVATVLLRPDGAMTVTDLVGDDLQTRFSGVTVLETVTVGGQVYVVAGGADDGLSLMALLPGGRLLHLDTIADDRAMALSRPGALALSADATGIDIFVAGGWPEGAPGSGGGVTRLRADLGAIGTVKGPGAGPETVTGTDGRDQIHGGPGDDRLSGGAGADVLIDGPGADRLTGGAGADVFVFTADGQTDRITDFEPGLDRLDLSDLGRFYTVDAVQITGTSKGARISVNGETVQVDSATGARLTAEDFSIGDLRDLWHIDSAAIPAAPLSMTGTAGVDLLEGRAAADTLVGAEGADILRGMQGDDRLQGEAPDPEFDPVSGQVFRLYQATLDRAPDLDGLLNWSARLAGGERSLVSVTAGFTKSAEFRNAYGALDDSGFVTQLYRNVLDRAPDARGLENWVQRLEDGMSRERVVLGFSESAEFKAETAAEAFAFSRAGLQQDYTDEVFRLYQATLDRAPDAGGLRNWSARLAEGQALQSVVSGFVKSAEFKATYGALEDRGFVTQLYRNVLDRAPDARGLENWVQRLEDGMSRERVVLGFSESAEFKAAMAPQLLSWMRGPGADDELDGGAGRNLLSGGLLSDSFVFRAQENGQHEVADLERWDLLRFEGFGYADPDELRTHLVQTGEGMLFADQGVQVFFVGTERADFHDDMFIL